MTKPYFAIGHSTRPLQAFVDLLKGVDIRLVVDVRTVPRSRSNPQYTGDALVALLSTLEIRYEHIVALGGLRNAGFRRSAVSTGRRPRSSGAGAIPQLPTKT